jgi:hypothetical protein
MFAAYSRATLFFFALRKKAVEPALLFLSLFSPIVDIGMETSGTIEFFHSDDGRFSLIILLLRHLLFCRSLTLFLSPSFATFSCSSCTRGSFFEYGLCMVEMRAPAEFELFSWVDREKKKKG